MYLLDESLIFPPVECADAEGLLAIGGDLSPERLLAAYRKGIFPWFDNSSPILWWFPDPRCVLFPEKIRISKSMKSVLKKEIFSFTTNKAFSEVISNCSVMERVGQDGTWITHEVIEAYTRLHKLGFAHSAEAWQDNELVGGLYGIKLGNVFFGESMFSKRTNASKFAFIQFVKQLQQDGVQLIDCQIHTQHLESLGAEMISGQQFSTLLQQLIT